MRSALDHLLLSLAPAAPDLGTSFRRITHDPASRVICFLPWRTSFGFAQLAGLIPKRFYACYELPGAVVSPEPGLSARAIRRVTRDAEQLVRTSQAPPKTFTIIGMSMGTVPATLLANRLQCRLCSIGSADRGDLMIWQSPAAIAVKQRAQERGYSIRDYTLALAGLNPVQNLDRLASKSVFIAGKHDLYVPQRRRSALLKAARCRAHRPAIQVLDAGHVETLRRAARALPELLREEPMQVAPVASP